MSAEVLTFSDTAIDGQTTRQKRRVSHAGKLVSLHIAFPGSTNNALDVAVNLIRSNTKHSRLFPSQDDTFFRWDSAVLGLQLELDLEAGVELEVEWANASGGDLNCPVVAVVERLQA